MRKDKAVVLLTFISLIALNASAGATVLLWGMLFWLPPFSWGNDTRSDKSGDMSDNAEDRDKSCILTEHKILLARVAFKTIVLGMLGSSCGERLACGAFSFDRSQQYRSASPTLYLLCFFRFCLYGSVCVDPRL